MTRHDNTATGSQYGCAATGMATGTVPGTVTSGADVYLRAILLQLKEEAHRDREKKRGLLC